MKTKDSSFDPAETFSERPDVYFSSNYSNDSWRPGIKSKPNFEMRKLTKTAIMNRSQRQAEEVEFVIFTRDNNLPDPYGTHSTAFRKHSWKDVATLYNTRFKNREEDWIQLAAMEKRYRENIQKFRELHPEYPTKITYSEKPKAVIPKRGKKRNGWSHDGVHGPKVAKNSPGYEITYCRPVQFADDSEETRFLVIELEGNNGKRIGCCVVPVAEICKTPGTYFKLLEEFPKTLKTSMLSTSQAILARYIQCISPVRLTKLPEYDFTFSQIFKNQGSTIPQLLIPFTWSFADASDLYLVATELEDNHVRNLVLDHWREIYRA